MAQDARAVAALGPNSLARKRKTGGCRAAVGLEAGGAVWGTTGAGEAGVDGPVEVGADCLGETMEGESPVLMAAGMVVASMAKVAARSCPAAGRRGTKGFATREANAG